MRVLVLGASGFVGRHLLPVLVGAGHQVMALSRHPPASSPGVEPFAGDALGPGTIARALRGCQAAINLVGINHPRGRQSYERVHVELVRDLVASAEAEGVARLVQVSVMCARADPGCPYHDTKLRSDELVRASRVPWVILRPAIVFGPDDAFTTRIRALIAKRVVPIPGAGQARHAPVHVDDLTQACERALALPGVVGQILPLAGLRALTYREIVGELAASEGRRIVAPRIPVGLLRLAACGLAPLPAPPITLAQLTMLVEGMAADTAPSWDRLGLEPRGFDAAHIR